MFQPHEERRGWARDQMIAANVPEPMIPIIEELLNTWWTSGIKNDAAVAATDVFSKLAMGHALVTEDEADAVYSPCRLGNVFMRDNVRVKLDFYSGPSGEVHNGRRGVVIGVRSGDVIVRYFDGRLPKIDAAHHSPQALEKRVR